MTDVVCLRVVRPYATEEEFLADEAWTVTSRSILLVGVSPQAEGAAVRIELTLSSGTALIVAEGTVVKHLPTTETRPAGLVVKFRRMSANSSEFVRRAAKMAAERPHLSSPTASSLVPTPSVINPPPPQVPVASLHPPEPLAPVTTRPAAVATGRSSTAPESIGKKTTKPPRGSARPDEPARAQSVSVIPQARRLSTLPPGAPVTPSKQPPTLRGQVTASPDSKTTRGFDAMTRLRQRSAEKPITVPPDRETILARLKRP